MKTRPTLPGIVTFFGVALYVIAGLWASQTGYDNPDPAKRDANIGAGLLGLLGIVIAACGLIIWLAGAASRFWRKRKKDSQK